MSVGAARPAEEERGEDRAWVFGLGLDGQDTDWVVRIKDQIMILMGFGWIWVNEYEFGKMG